MTDILADRFGRMTARAIRLCWHLDPQYTRPPHAWKRCTCAGDELRALACTCACHGKARRQPGRRRYFPGMPYARITDIITRETRTPGQLNRERSARLKLQKQPRLFQ